MGRIYLPSRNSSGEQEYLEYVTDSQLRLERMAPFGNLLLIIFMLSCAIYVFVKTVDHYPSASFLVGLVLAFVVLSFARGLGGALGVVIRLILSVLLLWVVLPVAMFAVILWMPHSLELALGTANGKGLSSLGFLAAAAMLAIYAITAFFSLRWVFRRKRYA